MRGSSARMVAGGWEAGGRANAGAGAAAPVAGGGAVSAAAAGGGAGAAVSATAWGEVVADSNRTASTGIMLER